MERCAGFRDEGQGLRFLDLGFKIEERVQGLGLRIQSSELRVQGLQLRA